MNNARLNKIIYANRKSDITRRRYLRTWVVLFYKIIFLKMLSMITSELVIGWYFSVPVVCGALWKMFNTTCNSNTPYNICGETKIMVSGVRSCLCFDRYPLICNTHGIPFTIPCLITGRLTVWNNCPIRVTVGRRPYKLTYSVPAPPPSDAHVSGVYDLTEGYRINPTGITRVLSCVIIVGW